MSWLQKVSLVSLRLALGGLYFYAGVSKLFDPSWSAAGYIAGAKTFVGLYQWLLQPDILSVVNALNAWGLTLIGVALILGIGTRVAVVSGITLMALYYLAALNFPYPNEHAFLVDEHVVYSLALLVLAAFGAGQLWSLSVWCARLPLCRRFPLIHAIIK